MSFKSLTKEIKPNFNNETSYSFLTFYNTHLKTSIQEGKLQKSSQTFAPSSLRCKRKNWFRLRGVEPDLIKDVDLTLEFTAQVGTSCHEVIQANLQQFLGDDWIDVESYLKTLKDGGKLEYDYEIYKSGFETMVYFPEIPIKFACDGILRWKGKIYLLEIKTCEYNSFSRLNAVKSEHLPQIYCYSSLMQIPNVLTLYQERMYGEIKCFEKIVNINDTEYVFNTFKEVKQAVEDNIAPERLPSGDKWCKNCEYKIKCKQWG